MLPWYAELLRKSASVRGFFLENFTSVLGQHMRLLIQLVSSGKLVSVIDEEAVLARISGEEKSVIKAANRFVGLEQVPAAIDRMVCISKA